MAGEQRAVLAARVHSDSEVVNSEREGNGRREQTVALAPRLIPVALSALMKGLGQAYNRQKQ
jgi:hypothetical protein